MATVSSKDFFAGGPVTVVGNETSPAYKKTAIAPPTALTLPQKDIGDLTADQYMESGKKIVESVQRAGGKLNLADTSLKGVVKNVGALGEGLLGSAAGAIQGVFAPMTAVIQKGLSKVGEVNAAQEAEHPSPTAPHPEAPDPVRDAIENWTKKHPDAARNLMDAFVVGTTAIGGEAGILGKEAAGMTLGEITPALKTAVTDVAQGTKNLATGAATFTKNAVTDLPGKFEKGLLPQTVKEKMAQSNIPLVKTGLGDQVKTASERLTAQRPLKGAGAAIRPDPIASYDDFIAQETKHLSDLKQDPAISKVGERIGDKYEEVAKKRREVGKAMSDEVKVSGDVKTDIKDALQSLNDELVESGAIYDPKTGTITTDKFSKFSSGDKSTLKYFASELNALGDNPTVKEIDAFVSRIPNEIEELKATRNIQFPTNAERIIKKSVNDLRGALERFGTDKYKTARKEYADLSNFLDEGIGFLGKKTQTGDYARDASIAKSAVQSVLNNGKKDWLMKLEELTGYPALDESLLALQAMKDLGDFKGNSLLELLAEEAESVPGKGGMIMGLLRGAGAVGSKALKGSSVEQTRNYLKGLPKDKGGGPKPQADDIVSAVEEAKAFEPTFKKLVNGVAKEGGWEVAHGPIKTAERIAEKSKNEGVAVSDMRDINRSTIMVESADNLASVAEAVEKAFGGIARIKNKFGAPGTYRSAIINVKTPSGRQAEIAVTTPEMWKAKVKLGGHEMYQKVRIKADDWIKVQKDMKALYNRAYELFLERSSKSS